jgi:hypothetical protein
MQCNKTKGGLSRLVCSMCSHLHWYQGRSSINIMPCMPALQPRHAFPCPSLQAKLVGCRRGTQLGRCPVGNCQILPELTSAMLLCRCSPITSGKQSECESGSIKKGVATVAKGLLPRCACAVKGI